MTSRLRISFFGPSLVSGHWNGAVAYYRGLVRALSERGHRVTFYEPDAYDRQQHRDIPNPAWARVVVYPASDESALEALERAETSDLIIKCSGVGVFDELLEAAVLEMKRPETLVAFLDMDPFLTLDRIRNDPDDAFRPLIPEYNLIFTCGGGAPVVAAYLEAGAAECVPICHALDPHIHFPVPSEKSFAADLGLLQNRIASREAAVEEFFFKPAAGMANRKFLLAGNGWQDKALPENAHYIQSIRSNEINAFNCSPLAVLNINPAEPPRARFSPPAPVFDAAGAGACLITEPWEGIEKFLEPDREVLVAKDAADVCAHLEGLTPERAREIGQAARSRMLAEHSYAHRAEQLEKILLGNAGRVTV